MGTAGMTAGSTRKVRTVEDHDRWQAQSRRHLRQRTRHHLRNQNGEEFDINDDGALELAVGIVRQAARDYEEVLMKLLSGPGETETNRLLAEKAEIERFFLSPVFEMYMEHTDGEAFMKQVQKNAAAKAREKAVGRLEKAGKKNSSRIQGKT